MSVTSVSVKRTSITTALEDFNSSTESCNYHYHLYSSSRIHNSKAGVLHYYFM